MTHYWSPTGVKELCVRKVVSSNEVVSIVLSLVDFSDGLSFCISETVVEERWGVFTLLTNLISIFLIPHYGDLNVYYFVRFSPKSYFYHFYKVLCSLLYLNYSSPFLESSLVDGKRLIFNGKLTYLVHNKICKIYLISLVYVNPHLPCTYLYSRYFLITIFKT